MASEPSPGGRLHALEAGLSLLVFPAAVVAALVGVVSGHWAALALVPAGWLFTAVGPVGRWSDGQ